ncbi:MAG: alpha-ketoacid dehydrogenase subunit beta [Gammaproteobacteria bacterium]|jgi:pyruvate/2-oxoglutarate/acetoin dehydrogenase E1 component|nr:alpha-ketoacid dehydrogenase subunit beta [Gammaproteobacteria bacterium]
MSFITFHQAYDDAVIEEMRRDSNVVLLGQGISGDDFRPRIKKAVPDNVVDMPIAEALMTNGAIGMALAGLRPICDLMFEDFTSLGFDAIVNQAAKIRFWSNGNVKVPMVVTAASGAGVGLGNNHSQKVAGWFTNVPGVKIALPSTPHDVKGLLKSAIRDDDVVLVFLHNRLNYKCSGEVPDDEYVVPLGKAYVARQGTDVTVVCWQLAYSYTMELAEELALDGISIEVVDPRTLCPLDKKTIVESVRKTGRLVVAHEEPYKFGPGAEIITAVVEDDPRNFKAPPVRAGTPMTAIPCFSVDLDVVVNKAQIRAAIYQVMGRSPPAA